MSTDNHNGNTEGDTTPSVVKDETTADQDSKYETDLPSDKIDDSNLNSDTLRKSERVPRPTEKMIDFRNEEAVKREKRFFLHYERWKKEVREGRSILRSGTDEGNVEKFLDTV